MRSLPPKDLESDPKYAYLLRTRAYLATLPQGLASYPHCRVKGSVWRNMAVASEMRRLEELVPAHLGILPDPNILGSAWFPAVQHFAAHLAMRDCLFASDDDIYLHFRLMNKRLLSGPLYRVMFALVSPQMVAHASDRRFAKLFEGVTLRVQERGPKENLVHLSYPHKLVPRLVARLYLTAFEAAMELAGADQVEGKLTEYGDTESNYLLSWR